MDQEEARPGGIADAQATSKIDEAKKMASDIAEEGKRKGREKLASGKQTAAEQTEKLADVVERAAQEMGDGELQSVADYAGQLAGGMKTLAENLRSKSIDELLKDTQQLARQNPMVFFIGSVALGVAFSRFLKASGDRQDHNQGSKYDLSEGQPAKPVFEHVPAGLPGAGSRKMASSVDTPSFADDLEKGI